MSLSMSPTVNQYQEQTAPGDEAQLFEQGFGQAAEGMLLSKMPEAISMILTFKVIKADIDSGSAVGVFILALGDDTVFVPALLIENELKPLEVMYVRSSGTFLPFTNEWLQELESKQLEPMGEGVVKPETLSTDIDVGNITHPPVDGRFSYASTRDLILVEIMDRVDNKVRTKLANLFKSTPSLLKTATSIYGLDNVKDMVARKEEPVKVTKVAKCVIYTRKDSAAALKQAFGPRVKQAMADIAAKGYAVCDNRVKTSSVVPIDRPLQLQDANRSGWYKFLTNSGEVQQVVVVPNPINPFDQTPYATPDAGVRTTAYRRNLSGTNNTEPAKTLVLNTTGDGSVVTAPLLGVPILVDENCDLDARFKTTEYPKRGWGVFIRRRGGNIEATEPLYVLSVVEDSGGVRRVHYAEYEATADCTNQFTFVTDPAYNTGKIRGPGGTRLKYLPPDFSFWPISADTKHSFGESLVKNPNVLSSVVNSSLLQSGGEVLKVAKQADSLYKLSSVGYGTSKMVTMMTLVLRHNLSEKTAAALLSLVDKVGATKVALISPLQQVKLAVEAALPPAFMGGAQPPMVDPAAAPPADPNAGVDPTQMPQAGGMPQDPSLVDQAIQEVKDKLVSISEQQQTQLEAQIQNLQHQLAALEAIGARTQEMAQGVPKDQSEVLHNNVQLDPKLMQEAEATMDPKIFDTTAVATLADSGSLSEVIVTYLPTLMKGLDHIGRILTTFWMKGSSLKEELGEEKYNTLEDKLRNVFRGVGDLLLHANRSAQVVRQGGEFSNEIVNRS